jgi:predicted MPP superfamily phosphohydrolase
MSLIRRLLVRNVVLTLMLFGGISETAVVEWALRASGNEGLGFAHALLLVIALAVANAGFIIMLRALPWRVRPVYWLSRVYVLVSLGALLSGPPLLALLLLVLPLRLAGAEVAEELSFLVGGGLMLTFGFGSILWGFVVGQRRLTVEQINLPVRELPRPLVGLRLLHLSDLHIGRQLRAPQLRRFVDRANSLGADAILLTGDLFDFDPVFIEEGCRELSRLSAPLGVYAVLGNHDVYTGAEAVAGGLQRLTSVRLLRDEWTWIERGGARLALLGIDDPGRGWTDRDFESEDLEALAKKAPLGVPRILLAHRPSYLRQASRLGIDLVLSGHTHGGQISLPAPYEHHNVSRLIAHWTRGLFEHKGTLLYVNRGLGVAGPPVRLNCPREIAVLELMPHGESRSGHACTPAPRDFVRATGRPF